MEDDEQAGGEGYLFKLIADTTVARMLVGNKCDLEDIRDVSVEESKSFAEEHGQFFMETSALDATNVQEAFEVVIREIYNNISRKVLNFSKKNKCPPRVISWLRY
ncbi:hypothetical protein M0R45_010205 [Rubus argutus]|uniref:Uncharacterized protein n=1 Tax=Rubus argutus TaxID=59490 RepID=A0AAW1Y6D2_RUBAR